MYHSSDSITSMTVKHDEITHDGGHSNEILNSPNLGLPSTQRVTDTMMRNNEHNRAKKQIITKRCDVKKDANIIEGTNGVYKINEKKIIGHGAFSYVYVGTNIETNLQVAIKKVKLINLNKYELTVVEREITIINKLMNNAKCPCENIVKFFDVVRTKTALYIVMEYCHNGVLTSLLVKPLREMYVKFYFKQILNGLNALHDLDIVHQDIKPDNLLITNEYKTIKICDFGFSYDGQNCSDLLNSLAYGSPIYMAPERFVPLDLNKNAHHTSNAKNNSNIKKLDKTGDIWSAGVVLYEMIHGYVPYRGLKDVKTLRKTSSEIEIADFVQYDISSECTSILKSMLHYNKQKRMTCSEIITSDWLNANICIDTVTLSDLFNPAFKIHFGLSKSVPHNTQDFDTLMRCKQQTEHSSDDSYDYSYKSTLKRATDVVNDRSFDDIMQKHNEQILKNKQNKTNPKHNELTSSATSNKNLNKKYEEIFDMDDD